jgi:hypothetical protein
MTPTQLPEQSKACELRYGRHDQVQRQMYEITFMGRAGAALWAEFEDCDVSVGPDTTTLRTELPDDGAITGLLLRISDLGLKVISLHRVAPREQ